MLCIFTIYYLLFYFFVGDVGIAAEIACDYRIGQQIGEHIIMSGCEQKCRFVPVGELANTVRNARGGYAVKNRAVLIGEDELLLRRQREREPKSPLLAFAQIGRRIQKRRAVGKTGRAEIPQRLHQIRVNAVDDSLVIWNREIGEVDALLCGDLFLQLAKNHALARAAWAGDINDVTGSDIDFAVALKRDSAEPVFGQAEHSHYHYAFFADDTVPLELFVDVVFTHTGYSILTTDY